MRSVLLAGLACAAVAVPHAHAGCVDDLRTGLTEHSEGPAPTIWRDSEGNLWMRQSPYLREDAAAVARFADCV